MKQDDARGIYVSFFFQFGSQTKVSTYLESK